MLHQTSKERFYRNPPTLTHISSYHQIITMSSDTDPTFESLFREDTDLVYEETPSFFGVYYNKAKDFRVAVEDAVINRGMHLEQVKELHSSSRPVIR